MENSCRFVKSARIRTFLKLYFFPTRFRVDGVLNRLESSFLNNVVLCLKRGLTPFVQRRLDTARKVSWGELWN